MRCLITSILLLTLSAGAAAAAAPAAAPKLSCDNPAFTPYVLARLGHGRSLASGTLVSNALQYGPITSVTQVSGDAEHMSCEITITVSSPKSTRSLRGVFTVARAPNGKMGSWKWLPGY